MALNPDFVKCMLDLVVFYDHRRRLGHRPQCVLIWDSKDWDPQEFDVEELRYLGRCGICREILQAQ